MIPPAPHSIIKMTFSLSLDNKQLQEKFYYNYYKNIQTIQANNEKKVIDFIIKNNITVDAYKSESTLIKTCAHLQLLIANTYLAAMIYKHTITDKNVTDAAKVIKIKDLLTPHIVKVMKLQDAISNNTKNEFCCKQSIFSSVCVNNTFCISELYKIAIDIGKDLRKFQNGNELEHLIKTKRGDIFGTYLNYNKNTYYALFDQGFFIGNINNFSHNDYQSMGPKYSSLMNYVMDTFYRDDLKDLIDLINIELLDIKGIFDSSKNSIDSLNFIKTCCIPSPLLLGESDRVFINDKKGPLKVFLKDIKNNNINSLLASSNPIAQHDFNTVNNVNDMAINNYIRDIVNIIGSMFSQDMYFEGILKTKIMIDRVERDVSSIIILPVGLLIYKYILRCSSYMDYKVILYGTADEQIIDIIHTAFIEKILLLHEIWDATSDNTNNPFFNAINEDNYDKNRAYVFDIFKFTKNIAGMFMKILSKNNYVKTIFSSTSIRGYNQAWFLMLIYYISKSLYTLYNWLSRLPNVQVGFVTKDGFVAMFRDEHNTDDSKLACLFSNMIDITATLFKIDNQIRKDPSGESVLYYQ